MSRRLKGGEAVPSLVVLAVKHSATFVSLWQYDTSQGGIVCILVQKSLRCKMAAADDDVDAAINVKPSLRRCIL